MTTSQRLTEAHLDEAISSTQECREWQSNQGRGPTPERARARDWLLAVVIGSGLALALISWGTEPEPAFTAVVQK